MIAKLPLFSVLSMLALMVGPAYPGDQLEEARKYMQTGKPAEAGKILNAMVTANPDNLAARLERGTLHAWQGRHVEADQDFAYVLSREPSNLGALNGAGYNHAWAGKFSEAESRFKETLRIAPGQPDAEKGLAYVALWRGDYDTAITRFGALAGAKPSSAEYQVALGQAHYGAGRVSQARTHFQRALELDPARVEAKQGLASTRIKPAPKLSFTLLGGHTWLPGNEESTGIRWGEIGLQATPALRIFARYDNGLSQDNRSLATRGQDAPAYSAGGFLRYGNWGTQLEAGLRDIEAGSDQKIFGVEQLRFFPGDQNAKLGGRFYHNDDGKTEWMAYAGYGFPVNRQFRLEPVLFYSRNTSTDSTDIRLLLGGEYAFANGLKLGAGVAGGEVDGPGINGNVIDSYVSLRWPITSGVDALANLRREVVDSKGITVFAIGFQANF